MHWEEDLADLLRELSSAQDELLAVLAEKRRYLASSDLEGMTALQPRETSLLRQLEQCHERRGRLLAAASENGAPAASLRALAASLPVERRGDLENQVKLAASRSRVLQHQGLTNWVIVQRTLLHLSQMLEIIATGGRSQPTYGKGEPPNNSGALVDQAA